MNSLPQTAHELVTIENETNYSLASRKAVLSHTHSGKVVLLCAEIHTRSFRADGQSHKQFKWLESDQLVIFAVVVLLIF